MANGGPDNRSQSVGKGIGGGGVPKVKREPTGSLFLIAYQTQVSADNPGSQLNVPAYGNRSAMCSWSLQRRWD